MSTARTFDTKPESTLARAVRYGGVLLAVCVGLVSCRYIAGVGPVPPNVLANRFFDHWIVVAGPAMIALLLALLWFIRPLFRNGRSGGTP